MQKIKLDNGCKYLKICEVATNRDNKSGICYLYHCSCKNMILDFGILKCHHCIHYEKKETTNE